MDGKVTDPRNSRAVAYASLSGGQKLAQTITDDTSLIPATGWKVAGQFALKANGRDELNTMNLWGGVDGPMG